MTPNRFSVLSLNIHKGFSPLNRRLVVHDLRERLHALSPDIVFLQEVQDAHSRHAARHADWPVLAQSRFLAEGLWPEVHYGRNAVYDHGHHGNLILSRFPVSRVRNDDISDHRFERRGLLHATIDVRGLPTHCFCVHLGLFERGRTRQIDTIIEAVEERAGRGEPVIVAGDFNDWRNTAEDRLRRIGLVDVFRERNVRLPRTFPGRLPILRLDRIYARDLTALGAQRMTSWSRLSDHLALFATFAPR
ncbi:MAG: endonuclease/exonuclease/phosphatase family protein [Burkholderiales bacterium]|nr:endonuclease/exonuclease/phosphatase family protein [Burkholderiales bacterium]